jgi:streptogramin lyase/predicted Ser/Thr protein kinase
MPVSDDTLAGSELGGYRVEQLVGRGGMGQVYRAHDLRLDRPVALKVLAPQFAGDEAFRGRITRESRLAAAIDHPNVVPVYEAGEDAGRIYIAMRFVEGTDLRSLRRREGTLAPEHAIAIGEQIAAALDAAHERGLVHRDVKPSNCLIDRHGNCYLADFGLTQSLAERVRPPNGQLMGTVDYVAPEQIRGDKLDGRADVYALGCVLHECLTGEAPFRRGSDVATLFAHLEEEPPSASGQRSGLPPAIDAVLARAMATEPAKRYSTCGEFIAEAKAALGLTVERAPRSRRRLAFSIVLAGGAMAAAVGSALLFGRGGASLTSPAGLLMRIDPARNAVAARHHVSAHPGVVTTSAGRVWFGDYREGALYRLEPADGDLTRIPSTGEPRDLSALSRSVYVASDSSTFLTGTITAYDSITGVREDGLDLLACSIAAGRGVVWAAGCPFVERLSTDAGKLRVIRALQLPFAQPRTGETDRTSLRDMTVGEGALWVTGDMVDRRVWRIAPRSGRILATIGLPYAPRSIAAGAGGVWVTAPMNDRVMRISPASNRVVATIPTGHGVSGVAVGDGSVWVTNFLAGTVMRIDPTDNRVVATIRVDALPREIVVGAGGVWVTADAR